MSEMTSIPVINVTGVRTHLLHPLSTGCQSRHILFSTGVAKRADSKRHSSQAASRLHTSHRPAALGWEFTSQPRRARLGSSRFVDCGSQRWLTMASSGKVTDWVHPNDSSGEFKRQVSSFRDWISRHEGAKYAAEKGRYHLYVSYACPWAHRTLIARKLKGLEDIISFSVVHWHLGQGGWRFVTKDENEPGEGVIPDPLDGHEDFTHLRHVYFESEKDYEGRFTVPVLYDKKTKRIVSNESSEILRMLGTEFDDLLDDKHRAIQLYPESLRSQIDETNTWTYDLINNGVYKSGFATTSDAYERNVHSLFEALDRAEKHISAQGGGPYYFGQQLTEADIRLYVTLIRFDPVYVQHFKCNIRDIRSGYPALHRWMRHLYWTHDAFQHTTQFEHIKWHYTRSHTQINPPAITPVGPLPHILKLEEEVAAVAAERK
ncbi:hypothetical protein E4U43_007413 [Claviceps pusilla]|uniref:GST C-terminal domain-containing protein n=1 Tax=Claviceps pusilla TaxID=123648 RepID=A0A9P7NCI6_9HYPO|nr:hypothetical protein E4U43_007413 [Claviceps pusilla]